MDQIFEPEGILAQTLKNYEYRREQKLMAEAVRQALAKERFLIVEAGTGTGKTLAYLIPAILSKKKVIVSTGTKTLQEQLFFKDLPLIRETLRLSFRAAFMKGRNNYLCLRRFRLHSRQPLLRGLDEVVHYQELKKWSKKTLTGDRAELAALPEDLPLWKEICASTDTCLGQACEFFQDCFITRMRQAAAAAEMVIVNHHLFFADLAVRLRGFGEVLPRYEAAVFDEAHQLEEVATQYLGFSLSNFRFEELSRDIRREIGAAKLRDETLLRVSDQILTTQEKFFNLLRREEGRYRLREEQIGPQGKEEAARLFEALNLLSAHVGGMKDPGEGIRALGRRGEILKTEFQEIFNFLESSYVHWGEAKGRGIFLHASPVEIGPHVQEHLYPRLHGAIFTSATISAAGNFDFFKSRLGLEGDWKEQTDELILDSSFNMEEQAVLYLPGGLPDPNQNSFVCKAAEEIEQILKVTAGRAFLLFTSLKNMEEAYRLLKDRLPYTCLIQGERPKSVLLQDFKEDVQSVLFATSSFWEGVDVQGEALSCVIIDRLPFSPPNEPILEARLAKIAEAGGSPFRDYQIPAAIILLKQGLGRLIRTRQDRGVMAILDNRVLTKSYGKIFLESLPACPILYSREGIEKFISGK
ncbi:MAG: ATP-dependent helicase [Deltaproteobacteria bacterium]|nr:ATP-dependent helicase [Deltaproteobacteria bacterium]